MNGNRFELYVQEVANSTETICIIGQSNDIVVKTEAFEIKDNASYVVACEILKEGSSQIKKIDEFRKEKTKTLDDAKGEIMDIFKPILEKMKTAKDNFNKAIIKYQDDVAEKQRKEQEQAEKDAKEAEEKAKKLLDKKIAKATEKGDTSKAEELSREKDQVIVAPVALQTEGVPKVAGVARKEVWTFEITDEKAVPLEYRVVDEVAIGKVVSALKDKTKIPGVRVFQKSGIASGKK